MYLSLIVLVWLCLGASAIMVGFYLILNIWFVPQSLSAWASAWESYSPFWRPIFRNGILPSLNNPPILSLKTIALLSDDSFLPWGLLTWPTLHLYFAFPHSQITCLACQTEFPQQLWPGSQSHCYFKCCWHDIVHRTFISLSICFPTSITCQCLF